MKNKNCFPSLKRDYSELKRRLKAEQKLKEKETKASAEAATIPQVKTQEKKEIKEEEISPNVNTSTENFT